MRSAAISLTDKQLPQYVLRRQRELSASCARWPPEWGNGCCAILRFKSNVTKGNSYEINYIASRHRCTDFRHLSACPRRITVRVAGTKRFHHRARSSDADTV